MAIGAPLVYADQAYSIWRKQDARGFSHDVCAVLLIANITRCFFWLGERFEFALLLQSILMIASQLGLLYLCIRFRPITANSKSISSDGARVVFQAPRDDSLDHDGQSLLHPHSNSRSEQSSSRLNPNNHAEDLMDLNTPQDQDIDADADSYPNKQPLLASLGIHFGRRSNYGVVSTNDPASSLSGGGGGASLPLPASTSTGTNANGPRSSFSFSNIVHKLRQGHRPLNFWQWEDYNSYLVFLSFYVVLLGVLYLIFGSAGSFVSLLGYVALGLESTLPVPQLLANFRRKSLAGFRPSVLVGWLGGDTFKLVYFLAKGSPRQFTVCAVFQLSIDLAILAQRHLYREKTEREEEELRQKAASRSTSRGEAQELEQDDEPQFNGPASSSSKNSTRSNTKSQNKSKAKRSSAREEEQDLFDAPQHVIQIEADDEDGDLAAPSTLGKSRR
ncbi:hypothetical protein BCV70DRAFT_198148 [Testicularia cyperi]|uniref:PQ-loop-domain-containing protein n=1 Tax=Testicularia cyperi TaxID=1882483 RepID=A0A317XX04_9BASI|nr:hypothetical protein BCV70DRAFT_198148 [Testicularia cyperi]